MKFLYAALIMLLTVPVAEARGHWHGNVWIGIPFGGYYAPPPPVYYYPPPPPVYYVQPAPVYVAPQPTCHFVEINPGASRLTCLAADGHWYFAN